MAGRVELSVVAKNQASKVLKQVGGDIRDLSREAGKAKSGFGDMFNVAGGNLLARGIQSATSAVLGLGRAFVGAIADATSASAQMNAQVSGIGAVLGLTTEELTQVKGLINQLGVDPNLKVNAQEAADAIDMLARNGLTLEQIMGGAAEATVFLANATGGTFDTSANVATDVMAMFKIRAEDMMTAVDGITSVTTSSKFSIDDYRLAISQAGGVASALGVEFEDFNTSIAATSASFASGSDAGTSFKTFLQRLVPQSNEASEAMAELGLYAFNTEAAMATLSSMGVKPLSSDMNGLISQLLSTYAATNNVNVSTEEGLAKFNAWAAEAGFVQNAFYDATGALKDMADISAVLSDATAGLTEQQKNQYLTQIFGSDAMRTAFGLAEKGAVVYTDLSKAAKELGVSEADLAEYAKDGITAFEALQVTMRKTDALEGAQMRMDNLSGDMEIFSGIVDSIRSQIGDKFDPALRKIFKSLTPLVSSFGPKLVGLADQLANTFVAPRVEEFIAQLQRAQDLATIAFEVTGGDTLTSALVGIGNLVGADVTIDTTAKVVSIDWLSGGFTHTYDALAQVTETSVGWGAWTHSYDAKAQIESTAVGWGAWSHTYNAKAQIDEQSVLWGAWSHTYDAKAEVDDTSIGWGFATHTYDAQAQITENGVGWGLVTHTYDAQAQIREEGVIWGLFTTTYDATGKIIKTEIAPDLPIPEIKANAKIEAYIETEGENLNLAEKFALRFAPGVLEFLQGFAPAIKPPLETDMAPLLTMQAPTLPVDFWPTFPTFAWPTMPSWTWPALPQWTMPALPSFTWPSLPEWKWPSLPALAWPTMPSFTWPTLPSWQWPTMPLWSWPSMPSFTWPSMPQWQWPTMPAFGWPSLPSWTWPALPSFAWPSLPSWSWPSLPSWEWPSLPTFTWPTMPTFTWPAIPTPAWLNSLLNWRPSLPSFFGGGDNGFTSDGSIGGNAAGTDNWKGGWTWVGERGPELLNLPKGSQVLSSTESKKMIGQLADGTTTATAVAPRQNVNVFSAIKTAADQFSRAGDKIAKTFETSMKDLEGALQKVPGLFSTSPVTADQMRMGELGVPQNFADDYVRRLTDEVVNGVDWEGVDISDAAARAGIDPTLPQKAILELFTKAWNDQSLFANPENLNLINQEAVKAALDQQAQQKLGQQNVMSLFGVTPEQARTQGTSAGTAAGGGLLTGITTALTDGSAGTQVATSIGASVTPEVMAPVGAGVVSGLISEMGKEEYGAQIGNALTGLFTGYLDKADSFASVAQSIMSRISSQFGNVTGLDMVSKFSDAFRSQLSEDDAIDSLARVGEKILEMVFRGYLDAAREKNWAEGVNAKGDTTNQSSTTTSTPTQVLASPRGRSSYPAESLALAGAGDVYITVNATVSNAIDINELAYRISDVIRRRR